MASDVWTPEVIENSRAPYPRGDAGRIVVGVDPGGRDGDERGIVVAGIAGDGDYYVLDDYSAQCCVKSCADLILTAYREYEADLVVAVSNLAGKYLGDLLWEMDRTVRYKAAVMMRGLEARAKPVPGWYVLNRVHHNNVFPELEEQMCALGETGPAARVSALLAALYELRGG
jgi:phage terminase large subunit-like protein